MTTLRIIEGGKAASRRHPERKLRIIILDSPIHHWNEPLTQSLFMQLVSLKLKGYGAEYPEGVLALDTNDFFSTHMLICEELPGSAPDQKPQYKVLSGCKSVSLDRCELFRVPFPALSTLRSSKQDERKLLALLESAKERGVSQAYVCSWTMDPAARRDRELPRILRDYLTTIGVRFHMDAGFEEWFACGASRFKTDQYLDWVGLKPITGQFAQYSLYDEPGITMYHLSRYSFQAQLVAKRMESAWEDRLIIARPEQPAARRRQAGRKAA